MVLLQIIDLIFKLAGLGLSLTKAEEPEYEVSVIQIVDNRLANQPSLDK